MKYDLSNDYKLECFQAYCEKLIRLQKWVELKEIRKPHSIDAHRLYFLWLNCIAKETQELDKDQLHYMYRATFLRRPDEEILPFLSQPVWDHIRNRIDHWVYFLELPRIIDLIAESTSIMAQDSKEFSNYLNKIRKHARSNFGVILLTLKDKGFEEFYRDYGFY